MKITSKILIAGLVAASLSCNDGYIDDITPVPQGDDETAPEVAINFPDPGPLTWVPEDVMAIDIDFEVMDDIEIQDIIVTMDGQEIGNYTDFRDYRKAAIKLPYENLTNGDHTLTVTANDLSGKTTTNTVEFEKPEDYIPQYDGEVFYMPFDGQYLELVSVSEATAVGEPGFAGESASGANAYAGATDSYLTFPAADLAEGEFSASLWYKVNANPDRAGILVIGPPDPDNPDAQNNRTAGFRLFREAAGSNQRIKLNVGNGSGENWFDGGATADINPGSGEWVHIAISISGTECAVYINGEPVSQGTFPGISWEGCDIMSIGSGAPRFSGWGHLSDNSFIDELRIFNKALSQTEVQGIMDDEQP
ncbi:LamG domain-containing protein [Echinicola strongylocentroti]|uniref:LamG domain-containing protein n=1 Tax=Echinicola strongylocentroti TaxID=1795355 RepID=A0A2Z4INR3_9BACT|nr:LamG domain-containing protein [Echinicola strongylocentroti]AWW31963.1 LamG domain-containing protein [Echinicola strongylocentroti]